MSEQSYLQRRAIDDNIDFNDLTIDSALVSTFCLLDYLQSNDHI